LTDYFLSEDEKYKEEINEQNPLGTKGKLVNAYAELLRDMWSGQSSSVRPFKLKVFCANSQTQKYNYIFSL
jgi:ubiquitin C-terminal hydrolase